MNQRLTWLNCRTWETNSLCGHRRAPAMKGPGGYEALRGSVDLRSAQAADGHRRTAVTITEMTGHDAETVGHDQPKCAVIIGRNVRSRSRNRRS